MIILGFAGALGFATTDYRITAAAAVEGNVHRALVAPIDGYIRTAEARAGNRVKAGELLATLDDERLTLEARQFQAERDELGNQHRRAVANLDRAEAKVLAAQIGRAEAQLALIESQLARTRISAPFDGIVVTGDLSRSLGAPVERGQVLFELAPLDSYRVALEIAEEDIADIVPGQSGHLALAAMPDERFAFMVEQIIGIARNDESGNVFRVEAQLVDGSARLRPGMKGVGKVTVERRKLFWVWTHNLHERISLWIWSHRP